MLDKAILDTYWPIARMARETRMTIPKVTRAIAALGIELYRYGNTQVLDSREKSRIKNAFKDGTIVRGRPAIKKAAGINGGPKQRFAR